MIRFLILNLFCAVLASPAAAQPRATPVGVDAVNRQAMSQTVPVIGRIVPLQSGVVAARTPGPVARLNVNIGDHVEKGDIIAELDQARLQMAKELQQAELGELEARKRTAQANTKLAQQELNRLEKLRNSAAFTRFDYDRRVQELEVARSSLQEADARILRGQLKIRQAEIELRDGVIRAPYAGTVTQRHTSEGAWLRIGDPVVTLISDSNLELEAEVPAERISALQKDTRVVIQLDDGSKHAAKVRALIPDENPAARTRPVRFVPEFADLSMPLAANQTVTVLVPAGAQTEVVTVHKDAVLRKGGQAVVYLVENGAAQLRPVDLGEPVGNRFAVKHGLQPGDIVVVRGNERLRPGQPVSYPEPGLARAQDKAREQAVSQ